jgi:ABC-2 type transport system permease protein
VVGPNSARQAWSPLDQGRLILHQFHYEIRGFVRSRSALFFTVMLPVIFLVLFYGIFRNKFVSVPGGGRIRESTYYVPALTSLGIISASCTSLVVSLVRQRENGILKRRRATPVPAHVLIAGRALVAIVLGLFMCALMLALGSVAFGAPVPTRTLPAVAVAAGVGAFSFCAIGYALSTFIKQIDAVQPVTNFLLLPLYLISGTFIPVRDIPTGVQSLAKIFPVGHLTLALLRPFEPGSTGLGFSWSDLAIVGLWGVGSMIVAVRRFSWSPLGG